MRTINPSPQLRNDTEQPATTARMLGEWREDPYILEPPCVIIPHLAVEGRVTLFSGREKIGKSTFAAGAVAAASMGLDVLGTPVPSAVGTLWYAIDEPIADAVRRFDALQANAATVILNESPRSVADLLSALEVDLNHFTDVDNVVIDTFSRVLAASGVDPNSSHEVEPVITKLVDFFHRENVSAVLLYHTGKAGREYRGSTAIGATVDEILTLRRRGQSDDDDFEDDDSDDGRRLLVQEGRNLRGRIRLSYEKGKYQLYDEAHPPREKILDSLALHGQCTRNELCKLVGGRKTTVLLAVSQLETEGLIITGPDRRLRLAVPEKTREPRGNHSGTVAGTGSQIRNPPSTETGTGDRRTEPEKIPFEDEAELFALRNERPGGRAA